MFRQKIAELTTVVEHKVPKGACAHAGLPDKNIPPYLSWSVHVPGGKVCIYLHGEDPAKLIGRTVRVKVVLMRRTREDGTQDDHIDLTVTDAPSTHRLFVVAHDEKAMKYANQKNWVNTLAVHVDALIIVAPRDIRYIQSDGFYNAQPKAPKQPLGVATCDQPCERTARASMGPRSTGNSTVDRMVNTEGWRIESEDDTIFVLAKMKNGNKVTQVVVKPKKTRSAAKR